MQQLQRSPGWFYGSGKNFRLPFIQAMLLARIAMLPMPQMPLNVINAMHRWTVLWW
jgi:hypothetical protein